MVTTPPASGQANAQAAQASGQAAQASGQAAQASGQAAQASGQAAQASGQASGQRVPVRPADLVTAAGHVRSALRPLLGRDWSVRAGDLTWTARRTLEHLPDTLCWYAAQLATRARGDLPGPRHGDPSLSIADVLTVTVATASILAEVVVAAKPTARAFHPAGQADPEGWAAMGCDELLIHADDIASGLGAVFEPPAELCERVLRRLFPWAPPGVDPWQGLRWANGRTALGDDERLGADWLWHCAPLDEWDGTVPRWSGPPGPV